MILNETILIDVVFFFFGFYFVKLIQSNCHIPVKADTDTIPQINETYIAAKQFLKPKLNLIRRFLTEMRLSDFDMNPENMKMIQEDFIEMRRSFNATADDLHMMLILSRMLGIIFMFDLFCFFIILIFSDFFFILLQV